MSNDLDGVPHFGIAICDTRRVDGYNDPPYTVFSNKIGGHIYFADKDFGTTLAVYFKISGNSVQFTVKECGSKVGYVNIAAIIFS